jgi:hypothetical protein
MSQDKMPEMHDAVGIGLAPVVKQTTYRIEIDCKNAEGFVTYDMKKGDLLGLFESFLVTDNEVSLKITKESL